MVGEAEAGGLPLHKMDSRGTNPVPSLQPTNFIYLLPIGWVPEVGFDPGLDDGWRCVPGENAQCTALVDTLLATHVNEEPFNRSGRALTPNPQAQALHQQYDSLVEEEVRSFCEQRSECSTAEDVKILEDAEDKLRTTQATVWALLPGKSVDFGMGKIPSS